MPPASLDLFCVCPPGLESILADEIAELGLRGEAVRGGVELSVSLAAVARLNLWLRTATRVLVRLGSVRATTFAELVKKAKALPFELCAEGGASAPPIALRVTCRKSRLYHSGAVAERLHAAIEARLGTRVALAEAADDDAADQKRSQLIVARFERDVCTVSADSSGAPLHQRGWRAQGGKAPLRETLAAALLRAAGWRGTAETGALFDPLCGSGTIAIEAALLARRRAPGLAREFAFLDWPRFDRSLLDRAVTEARSQELAKSPVAIAASDQDAGAIAIARRNADAAGVGGDIAIAQRPLALAEPPATAGLLIANAPYGVRIGGGDQAALHRDLGEIARKRFAGWRFALLVAKGGPLHASGLAWRELAHFQNGGIPVSLLGAEGNKQS